MVSIKILHTLEKNHKKSYFRGVSFVKGLWYNKHISLYGYKYKDDMISKGLVMCVKKR